MCTDKSSTRFWPDFASGPARRAGAPGISVAGANWGRPLDRGARTREGERPAVYAGDDIVSTPRPAGIRTPKHGPEALSNRRRTRVQDTRTPSDWRQLEFPLPNGGCLACFPVPAYVPDILS
jgi:hypothetical protein